MNDKRIEKLIARLKNKEKIRILFVCLGNICRSPAADGIMHSIVGSHHDDARWEIDSAGIGNWHAGQLPDKRMRVHASRRGLDLTHHARQVRVSDFDDFDLIVGMDNNNIADLRQLAPSPEAMEKIVPMAHWVRTVASRYDYIPDPYYEGAEGFELVLDLLESGCQALYEDLSKA